MPRETKTVDFNHVWAAVEIVLVDYEERHTVKVENLSTLITDITTAVLDSDQLGAVPDRDRLISPHPRVYGGDLRDHYVPQSPILTTDSTVSEHS